MTNACRFGWFENGRVTKYVPGLLKTDEPADNTSFEAKLMRGPNDILIVDTCINGTRWCGRLYPKKTGQRHGIVVLYQSPR